MSEYLERLRNYASLFYSYFPSERKDKDLVALRGHQLVESLIFMYLRNHLHNPEHLDDFRVRWDSLIALINAMRYLNRAEEEWVWTATARLERVRNHYAHYLEPTKSEKLEADFVNCVRSNYPLFKEVPGEDDLKRSIFILYFSLCGLLALEEFPPCTATSIVRETISRECTALISQGLVKRDDAT